MRILRMTSLVLLFLSLIGCQATHLIYVHESNLGVVLTPVAVQGTSKFSIGFDRETYALVPKKSGTGTDTEAMSLVGASRIKVKGLSDLKFGHVIATGAAAALLSESAVKLEEVQQKLFEEQEE